MEKIDYSDVIGALMERIYESAEELKEKCGYRGNILFDNISCVGDVICAGRDIECLIEALEIVRDSFEKSYSFEDDDGDEEIEVYVLNV